MNLTKEDAAELRELAEEWAYISRECGEDCGPYSILYTRMSNARAAFERRLAELTEG